MALAVKTELRTGYPAVPHHPKIGDAVAGVERVGRINEKKLPFLLVLLLGEEGSCRMHCALYSGF